MQSHTRSCSVKLVRLTLSPSPQFFFFYCESRLVKTCWYSPDGNKNAWGLLAPWRRAQPLKEEKQNLREAEKAGRERRQADAPRTEQRELQMCGRQRRRGCLACTSENWEDVHLVIYLISLRCVISLCHTSCHLTVKSNARWMFEYPFREASATSRALRSKLWKQASELRL